MRIPLNMMSRTVFGCLTSEIFAWSRLFRDIAGFIEDSRPVQLGGPNKIVEGDGMFVIGKRKGGVGRWFSKEHVYVVTERSSRKIRRKVVPDKSASVLSVFDAHIVQGSIFMCDEGKENDHFKNLSSIVYIYTVPGPIHVHLSAR